MEIYSKEQRDEVLKTGEYKNHKWVIRTLGRYPCAYVSVSNKMTIEEAESLEAPYCGITYSSTDYGRLDCLDENYNWIGWDYGHCHDYNAMFNDGGQKHTLEEIEENVIQTIEELEK